MRVSHTVILPLLVATACASGSGGSGTSTQAPATQSGASSAPARTLVASLSPMNNAGNRILGSVKLTPTGTDGYRAEVEIRNGGGPQNKYPWVIRPGQCGDDNRDVLGNELAYRVLETTADGTVRITAPLRLRIPEGVFHINVLKGTGPSDREVVVSCGVLSAG